MKVLTVTMDGRKPAVSATSSCDKTLRVYALEFEI